MYLMKKGIALVLSIAMVLGLFGCQSKEIDSQSDGTTKDESKGFRAGDARVNITPSYSVPLAGYGNTSGRMSQGYLDYLYATCIAVTDENDSTVLLISLDLISTRDSYLQDARNAIAEATGITADRIMVQATHTHSAPDMASTEPVIAQYKAELVNWIKEAAVAAMADRSPATMHTGFGQTKGLSFVRHYLLDTGDIYGDNLTWPSGASYVGHTSEPDNEIQLLVFKREAADKKDIMAVNWACHPKMNSTSETKEGLANRSKMSADFIGGCRDYIESKSDYLFAFYQGAAGNINPNSKIKDETVTTDYKLYGRLLSTSILVGAENLTPVEGTAIKSTQQIYEAPIDKSEDHLLEEANIINTAWRENNDAKAAMALVPGTTIGSVYHASSIVSRSKQSGNRSMELNAISIGPVGFITAPYEMFDTNGMFIKEGSPFETTFVMTCANGANNYIAADYAFEKGGTYEVHNRVFPRGTAEDLANTYVEMLKRLKG